VSYDDLAKSIQEISEKLANFQRKPIVELKIKGDKIETDHIQNQVSRLNSLSLRCFWGVVNKKSDSSIYLERPNIIDEELFNLAIDSLGSERLASFAVKELLPLLSTEQIKEAGLILVENFEKYKKEKNN
ncbi:MAG TPA: DNA double-strand break repair protein Mre11, partial [Nitrosopumilaceae archaeon]